MAHYNHSRSGSPFRDFIANLLTADLRSLALFRICLGSVVIVDLLDRLVDARVYYTDFGALPRDVMTNHADLSRLAVFQLMNGSLLFQCLIFGIQLMFALSFLLGFRTRVSAFFLWLLTLSLESRNIQIGYSVDVVLRMGLLWGAMLPLGARFSVDRALAAPSAGRPRAQAASPDENLYRSPAVTGLMFLLISVYFFSAILKGQHPAWMNGMGTYYALSIDEYVMPLGRWMLQHPSLVKLANHGTLLLEAVGWIPLFIPWRRQWLRLPLFVSFALFHLGMGLCLNVTLFQFAAVATWTFILPEAFWTYANRWFGNGVREPLRKLRERVAQEWQAWELPSGSPPEARPPGKALSALAYLVLLICFYWNMREVAPEHFVVPQPVQNVALAFGLDQRWDMFASPAEDSGWFVIPAVLADGSVVDLFRAGAPLDWRKPAEVFRQFRDERMRKMMLRLAGFNVDPLRMAYAQYLCRQWNDDHPEPSKRLEAFKIIFEQQMILPDGGKGAPSPLMLWRHECGAGRLDKWEPRLDEEIRKSGATS